MIFRRHQRNCPYRRKGRRHWTCSCPIWLDARINGERILVSMGLTDWQEAQAIEQDWVEQGKKPAEPDATPPPKEIEEITTDQAWENFIARAKARNLSAATIYKYRLLQRQMQTFARRKGLSGVREFTLDLLEEFQSGWKLGPLSASKQLERLKAFFRAAQIHRWIDEDPAAAVQGPKFRPRPTLPFTCDEMKRILAATELYPDKTGKCGQANAGRLRAFCLLLRFSGMRIGDAVSLRTERLDGSKLFLYTQKTGCPVHCILPDFVAAALRALRSSSENYFFWTGNSTLHTAIGIWQRSLSNLFELAGIENGYAHRFRDTFSVELLQAGVPIEEVSVLLGHSGSRITSMHYAPWVRSRQEQLSNHLHRAWSCDPIVLIEEENAQKSREETHPVN
jgi:integrase/recombinase XerD